MVIIMNAPEGRTPDVEKVTVTISLQGEAALRLQIWADQMHMTKSYAAKRMLLEGMIQNGLLLKSYLDPGK